MKTAREQLYEEAIALLEKRADESSAAVMRKIMARYRVQTKPGVEIPAGITARDALGDRLVELWRNGANDDATRGRIGTTIDEFRMQLKQNGAAAGEKPAVAARPPRPSPAHRASEHRASEHRASEHRAAEPRPDPRTPTDAARRAPSTPVAPVTPPKPARPAVTLGMSDPPARLARGPEPVAGGPRTRKKARGECPKCKSKGVVLARSYSGDEYYSCIYCGWQAYKAVDEDDPNAPLAIRMLGQTVGSE